MDNESITKTVMNELKDYITNVVENADKWITIKPHGEDNPDYRRLKLEDGETPKEAIDRVYKKDGVKDKNVLHKANKKIKKFDKYNNEQKDFIISALYQEKPLEYAKEQAYEGIEKTFPFIEKTEKNIYEVLKDNHKNGISKNIAKNNIIRNYLQGDYLKNIETLFFTYLNDFEEGEYTTEEIAKKLNINDLDLLKKFNRALSINKEKFINFSETLGLDKISIHPISDKIKTSDKYKNKISEIDDKINKIKYQDANQEPKKQSNCEDVKSAEQFAKENNLANEIYYGNLDISVCNQINNSLLELYQDFPKVREMNSQIGSSQAINKERFDIAFKEKGKEIEERIRQVVEKVYGYRGKDVVEKTIQKDVKKRIEENIDLINNRGTLGHFTFAPPEHKGISFDGTKFSKNKLESTIIDRKLSIKMNKWHPVGCESAKSTIDHEIGHSIDYYIKGHNPKENNAYKELQKYYSGIILNKQENGYSKIVNGLSEYATSSFEEFIAEGWSEYKNNPEPREIATTIGKLLTKAYKECE